MKCAFVIALCIACSVAFPQGTREDRFLRQPFTPGDNLLGPNQQNPEEPIDVPPIPYSFAFAVNDDIETNYQQRTEKSDGEVIRGSYTVVDPDGFVRKVTYTADPENGFQAQVTREKTDIKVKQPPPPAEQSLGSEPTKDSLRRQKSQNSANSFFQPPPQAPSPSQFVRERNPPAPQQQNGFFNSQDFTIPQPPPQQQREFLLAADGANGGNQFTVLRKITAEQARSLGIDV